MAGNNKKKECADIKNAPTEQEKKLITTTDLAKFLGKTGRRIQQLTQDGIIETVPGKNGRGHKYDFDDTILKYIKHLEEKANGKAQFDTEVELKKKKLTAEAALKESQSDLHKIKTDIARGKYIPLEEVELDYKKFFSVFKKFATAIPNRISIQIGSVVEPVEARKIENDISEEINRMLRMFTVAAIEIEDDYED